MKNAFLGALLLLTAACGAYSFPGSPSPPPGIVSGRVISVPCYPVQPAQNACVGRPVYDVEISFQNGSAVEATKTDSNGDYSIKLATGTWKVTLKTYMRVVSGPPAVTVAPGSKVVANYVLDSGIRHPVPQQ
jgi:hypothetical protein